MQEMDGIREYHIELDKPSSKAQISHVHAHLWNLGLK
jgi:hypothetical protein